jgi:hypothetical protein
MRWTRDDAMGFPIVLPNAIVLYRNDTQRTFILRALTKPDATTPDADATPIDLTQYGDQWTSQIRPDTENATIITVISIDASNAAQGELAFAITEQNWSDGLDKYPNSVFDIQVQNTNEDTLTIWVGKFKVNPDVTRP